MRRNTQGWQRWQRLTACLLIYALFMHGIAFAVAGAMSGARLSADGAGAAYLAAFELCTHNNAAPGQPGAAGPGFVLEPPAVSTVFCPVEISTTPWPLAAWRLAPATVDASARPRGPPTARDARRP
jgi:hypothetical protein